MKNERGFTLVELLVSTGLTLIVLAGAMTAFKDALQVNETGSLVGDSTQNLRAATNLLVRDLMQAGRGIPTGGVPIPSGANSVAVNRPGPPGSAYTFTFNNANLTTMPAVFPGSALGPMIDGQSTDIVTMLMTDPSLPSLTVNPAPPVAGQALLAADGSNLTLGVDKTWLAGASGVKTGDLIMFTNALGNAIQMVTGTDNVAVVSFAPNDPLQINQPGAGQGSITQIITAPIPQTTAQRVLLVTYYVDSVSTPGIPRLARRINASAGQALAGVVEDLDLTYDLVDGVNNPVAQPTVPVTIGVNLYTPNQIRKINLHIGVRSEEKSVQRSDYLRNHLNTVISVRSLAYVDRYQ